MIRKGTHVKWKWGTSYATGKVEEIHDKPISKTIKGSVIKRKGEKNNKALVIKQTDGTTVLKLQSEVTRND